jgi:superfamily II DNA/RNA helicase
MPSSDSIPSPGQIVRVRTRRHLVESVEYSSNGKGSTLVSLNCIDDDALGESIRVLWEKEVDAEIILDEGWKRIGDRGFDAPGLFSAYLNTLRWNTVTATDPTLFQAPFRAGIEVMAYQLEPLRKALQLPRVNLFIADDVGLGKTIEAALIVREMMLRQRVQRVVVAAPPAVVPQWREEFEERFGLTFVIYDREYVRQKRIERGHGVNPWTTHSRFIISHALLRDPAYVVGLQDWLGSYSPGSLLILDEAHHAAPSSGARYAIDSRFTRTIRDLANRFEHRLFLSATPHNGHANSFASLLELLDPQRFTRGVEVKSAKELDAVMVRRLKEDLRRIQGGFAVRLVPAIRINDLPIDAPELTLAALLSELRDLRFKRLATSAHSARSAGRLTVIVLQKRLLSSIEAFARTLAVHERSLERLRTQEATQAFAEASVAESTLQLLRETWGSDDEMADSPEEANDALEDAAMERATAASGSGATEAIDRELIVVGKMRRIAEQHRYVSDARVVRLVEWLRENLCPGLGVDQEGPEPARWLPRRVIIFTEYTDTKRYLEQQLRSAISGTDREDERIAVYHGGMGEDAREDVKRAFNEDPAEHPVRILIATDAAREGLNLQQHCADLFHFDLPWNPARLEQRNGRIDRKGQREAEVRCHYFVIEQRPEDRVLDTLVRKTETIRQQLGSLAPVLQRDVEALLSDGIARDNADALRTKIDVAELDAKKKATVEEQLESARERGQNLEKQLDRLQTLMGKAKEWLNFDADRFRHVLDRALGLAGAPPLASVEHMGRHAWRVTVPTNDAAWSDTADTLRRPKDRRTSREEWRRTSAIRPVVFEDNGHLDSDVVHLHLEHRLAQRLLGRFTALGLVHYDLARACVGHTRDSQPRVILLGRLGLLGPRAGRLHDEIIAVAARWRPLAARGGPLEPYAEGGRAEAQTLAMLDEALPRADANRVAPEVERRLMETIPRDVEDLRPHLERRADVAKSEAALLLEARADREAVELAALIRERTQRILVAQKQSAQLELEFAVDELKQLRAEQKHWERRLRDLEIELRDEPERLRESYAVRSARVEPIGLVYLWPVSG